ncbi:hypothetical protein RDI58_003610 [Solanum bulbocastanum]|uniref:Uncharacterized protein n=1 Tax=Solanum bulbocastanum TaxID=147425 RepID=A0AAN8UGN4_SOLBU
MGSSRMDTTNVKEIVVKANIRETPKTHRGTEHSSSSSSSKTQLSNNAVQRRVYRIKCIQIPITISLMMQQ